MSYQSENCPKLKSYGIGTNTTGLQDDYPLPVVKSQKIIDLCLECNEKVCLLTIGKPTGRPKTRLTLR